MGQKMRYAIFKIMMKTIINAGDMRAITAIQAKTSPLASLNMIPIEWWARGKKIMINAHFAIDWV